MLTLPSVSEKLSRSLFPPGLSPYDQCWQQPCGNTVPASSSHSAKIFAAILRIKLHILHVSMLMIEFFPHLTPDIVSVLITFQIRPYLLCIRQELLISSAVLCEVCCTWFSKIYITVLCFLQHFTTGGHKVGLSNTWQLWQPTELFEQLHLMCDFCSFWSFYDVLWTNFTRYMTVIPELLWYVFHLMCTLMYTNICFTELHVSGQKCYVDVREWAGCFERIVRQQ